MSRNGDRAGLSWTKAGVVVAFVSVCCTATGILIALSIGSTQIFQGGVQIDQGEDTSNKLATQSANQDIQLTQQALQIEGLNGIGTLSALAVTVGPGPTQTTIAQQIQGTEDALSSLQHLESPQEQMPPKTARPFPTLISITESEEIMSANFEDSDNRWNFSGGGEYIEYRNGLLILKCVGPAAWQDGCSEGVRYYDGSRSEITGSYAKPSKEAGDFILEVDTQYIAGTGLSSGVLFRQRDNSNYYEFLVRNDRRYEFAVVKDTKREVLLESFSSVINQEGEVNRIHIEAKGNIFRFFINGQFVDEYTDTSTSFSVGDIILVTVRPVDGEFLEVAFDNFILASHP